MSDLFLDDIRRVRESNGKVVIKAWVYENAEWTFRELTDAEWNAWLRLTGGGDNLTLQ